MAADRGELLPYLGERSPRSGIGTGYAAFATMALFTFLTLPLWTGGPSPRAVRIADGHTSPGSSSVTGDTPGLGASSTEVCAPGKAGTDAADLCTTPFVTVSEHRVRPVSSRKAHTSSLVFPPPSPARPVVEAAAFVTLDDSPEPGGLIPLIGDWLQASSGSR